MIEPQSGPWPDDQLPAVLPAPDVMSAVAMSPVDAGAGERADIDTPGGNSTDKVEGGKTSAASSLNSTVIGTLPALERQSSSIQVACSSEEVPPIPRADPKIAKTRHQPFPTHDPSGRAYLPDTKLYSKSQAIGLIVLVTVAMANNGMVLNSFNVALPTVQKDLNMEEADLQWIVSAFSLTSACFLLLSGRLADMFGRKRCYLTGMVLFAAFTTGSGFAQTGTSLIVLRALSGLGVAIGIPSAMGIIATTFQGSWRASAFASFAASAPLGGVTGAVIGGLVTTYTSTSWRTAPWIFAGITVLIIITFFFTVPKDGPMTADKRVDWIGAALATLGLIALQLSISQANISSAGWETHWIIALLVISIVLLAGFVFWEYWMAHHTSRPPLLRLALFTRGHGKLASIYAVGCFLFMGFSSNGYHIGLFYQQVQLTGVLGAVVRSLPAPVSGVICNFIVAKIVASVKTQWIICTGLACTMTASLLFSFAGPHSTYWGFAFNGMWLNVVGADFTMATSTLFVSTLADPGEQSVAGALFQTLLQVGATLGLSLTTTIATAYTHKATAAGDDDIQALDAGFKAAFRLSAGIVFVALVIAVGMLRGLGIINRAAPPAQPPVTASSPEQQMEHGLVRDTDSEKGRID